MKKVLLLVAVALAFTLTAAAQDTGTQTTTSQTTTTTTKTKKNKGEAKEAKEGKGTTLTGCLAAGTDPNTYTLAHGKRNVTVTGMDLSQHVGHEVKLTGAWEKAAAGEANASAGGKKAGREFKASNVEHISDTCSAQTAAKGEKTTKTKSKSKSTTTTTPPGF